MCSACLRESPSVGDVMFNNSLNVNETLFYGNHYNETPLTYGNHYNETPLTYGNHYNETLFGNRDNATVAKVLLTVTIAADHYNVTTPDVFDVYDYEASLYASDLALVNGSIDPYVTYVIYAIVIPVFGVIGVMLNGMSVLVLHHIHFRNLGSLLIQALLIFDTFLLITLILITTPGALLGYHYPNGPPLDSFQPWPVLDVTQILYVAVSPLVSLAHDLDLWCIVVLLGEQFAGHCRPTWLTHKDSRGFGVKIIATLLAGGLLGQLVPFFKYVRREILYGYRNVHKKVCLSAYYRSRIVQIYDRYISFSIFSLLPLLLLLLLVANLAFTILRARHRRRSSPWEMNEEEMGRIFKGVRSTRLALILALTGLLSHSAASAVYVVSVKGLQSEDEFLSAQCHVIPLEVKVDYGNGPEFVVIYHALQAAPASIRFFTIYAGLEEFRMELGRKARQNWSRIKRICGGVFLPHPNSDGSSTSQ